MAQTSETTYEDVWSRNLREFYIKETGRVQLDYVFTSSD